MKKYLGKELTAPYDGPKTTSVPNPDKEQIRSLGKRQLNQLCRAIQACNNIRELDELQQCIDFAQVLAERNLAKPDEVEQVNWEGSLVNEGIRCGRPGCKCEEGNLHGPYWYVHTERGPRKSKQGRGGKAK